MTGRPHVVLLNYLDVFGSLHEVKYRLWTDHGISMPGDDELLNNVTALFRSGNGAHGSLKTGTTPSAGQRLEVLDKVRLPGVVSGGAQPEEAEKARDRERGDFVRVASATSVRNARRVSAPRPP